MRFLEILVPLIVITKVVILVPIIAILTKCEEIESPLLVNTTVGSIHGLRAEDGSAMFLGIPYAVVDPKNPFGSANPNPIFNDVFYAFNDSVMCPQLMDLPMTTLDCLHIHVHLPRVLAKKQLPVFVYIHGGEYMYGTSGRSKYDPKFLIRHNVIFVSINYRLSAYGFMCLHTPEVPGNQGLKDQINALRWIKKNIKAFGGDDENITIVGNSSGAMSVDLHLLFTEEGLFHKVIALSGTSLAPTSFLEPDLKAAIKIASHLGFQVNNTKQAVIYLSKHTPAQVLLAAANLKMTFSPCVEKKIPNIDQLIISHPVCTPYARARNIPIIYGFNDDEMYAMCYNMSLQSSESLDVFNRIINIGFEFGNNSVPMNTFVRQFYVADVPLSLKHKQAIIDFESDFRIVHPTQRTLVKYLEYGGVAYQYMFGYVGGRNIERMKYKVTQGGRAAHADDLGYLFERPELTETPTSDDQLIIDRITTLYTNFAKYGNPTPSATELLPIKWLPITKDKLRYLKITKNMELSTRPFHRRLSFWDLVYHANRKFVKGYCKEISELG